MIRPVQTTKICIIQSRVLNFRSITSNKIHYKFIFSRRFTANTVSSGVAKPVKRI
jgi:hypothetical protein